MHALSPLLCTLHTTGRYLRLSETLLPFGCTFRAKRALENGIDKPCLLGTQRSSSQPAEWTAVIGIHCPDASEHMVLHAKNAECATLVQRMRRTDEINIPSIPTRVNPEKGTK
jgi:hypothetical protein